MIARGKGRRGVKKAARFRQRMRNDGDLDQGLVARLNRLERRVHDAEARRVMSDKILQTPDGRIAVAIEQMMHTQDIRNALIALADALNRSTELAKIMAGKL